MYTREIKVYYQHYRNSENVLISFYICSNKERIYINDCKLIHDQNVLTKLINFNLGNEICTVLHLRS